MVNQVFCDIAISADGYVAGPGQTAEKPFGDGPVDRLHAWMFDTPEENKAELDQVATAGAFVMGRNMFGPGRGEWDLSWEGWWGDDPPYHAPVFVLTHHPRGPLMMEGGTTFTFVTDGIESALDQARKTAGDRDVAIAGGAATVNQYLAVGLIDEIRTHIAPGHRRRGRTPLRRRTATEPRDYRRTRRLAHHPHQLPRAPLTRDPLDCSSARRAAGVDRARCSCWPAPLCLPGRAPALGGRRLTAPLLIHAAAPDPSRERDPHLVRAL
jgi:dihydrofolate reductase